MVPEKSSSEVVEEALPVEDEGFSPHCFCIFCAIFSLNSQAYCYVENVKVNGSKSMIASLSNYFKSSAVAFAQISTWSVEANSKIFS